MPFYVGIVVNLTELAAIPIHHLCRSVHDQAIGQRDIMFCLALFPIILVQVNKCRTFEIVSFYQFVIFICYDLIN